MARFLIVAHETVTNPQLLKQVRTVTDQDPEAEFVLLVPATALAHPAGRRARGKDLFYC